MSKRRRSRIPLIAVVAFTSVIAFAVPARALPLIECRLSASATQSVIAPGAPATYDWDVIMIGACSGDNEGQYAAFGSADGTSLGLGLCDGSLVIQNLDLDVTLFLDSVKGPAFSKFLHERWSAAITTFPVVTPYLVEDVSGAAPELVGAGVLLEHLGLNCSANASPSTLILNVRLT
jgi:hypothetical protein